jgi:cytochrome P450
MGTPQVVATISTFILAMVLFPDVQRKAQEEIDRVIGTGRLPNFADRDHLPYLSAMYKELLRWHVIGPMGTPPSLKPAAYLIKSFQEFRIRQRKMTGTGTTSFPRAR